MCGEINAILWLEGGIQIVNLGAQALVQACDGSDDDKAIFMSCYALMLFGVPNRGLETSSLMAMVKGQPNEALVRDLSESSRFLSLLQSMFYERFTIDSSRIICIYETQMTPTVEVAIPAFSCYVDII